VRNGHRLAVTGSRLRLSLLLRAHGCGFLLASNASRAGRAAAETAPHGGSYRFGRA
jgi:hypothetical protein